MALLIALSARSAGFRQSLRISHLIPVKVLESHVFKRLEKRFRKGFNIKFDNVGLGARVKRKKPGGHPSDEEMQTIKEAYARYTDPNVPQEERPTQEDLEKTYGIPQATLSYWFHKFDVEGTEGASEVEKPPGDRRSTKPGRDNIALTSQRTTTKEAIKGIGELSRENYAKAINIGFEAVNNYGDLVELALRKGITIKDFIAEVFSCYEGREERDRYIHDLEIDNAGLRELTEPNYIFKRKSQCILDFAKECASLNKAGAHINIKQAARALQHDLDRIDEEIETKMEEIKTKIEMNVNG